MEKNNYFPFFYIYIGILIIIFYFCSQSSSSSSSSSSRVVKSYNGKVQNGIMDLGYQLILQKDGS